MTFNYKTDSKHPKVRSYLDRNQNTQISDEDIDGILANLPEGLPSEPMIIAMRARNELKERLA